MFMKKKVIALALASVLAMSVLTGLAGCSEPADAGKEEEKSGEEGGDSGESTEGKNIGVLIFNYANDYISYVRKGLEAEADKAGVSYQTSDANDNQPTQTEQVDTLLSKGVDGLCVALVESTAAETVIEKCRPSNTPVVFLNKKPTAEVLNTYDNCWYVGCATQLPGEQETQMMIDDFKADSSLDKNGDGKIQFVVIKGENGHENSEARLVGMEKIIEESDIECEMLDMQVGGWNTQKAKDIMDAWISKYGDEIEVVLSQNDAMALGAIESLRGQGYFEDGGKTMAVYGINCIQTGLEAMEAGYLKGSVMTDMITEGATGFKVIQNAMNGVDIQTGIDFPYDEESKFFFVDSIPIRLEDIDTAWAMYK
ncbi:MAG: substrate-binding domain-containing protein [Coprococcus sp.]|nr:substrate-binding domain-containing protein [Coprococcus sp.]